MNPRRRAAVEALERARRAMHPPPPLPSAGVALDPLPLFPVEPRADGAPACSGRASWSEPCDRPGLVAVFAHDERRDALLFMVYACPEHARRMCATIARDAKTPYTQAWDAPRPPNAR